MLELKKLQNQKRYKISGVELGGEFGENPCLLIGSIFYWSHKIVEDPRKGAFDKEKAEELINYQDTLADSTGLQCAYDIVGQSPRAMERYLAFVARHTDNPLIIDAVTEKVRVHGAAYSKEVGLTDRVIYNSIAPWTKNSELEIIKESGIMNGILFTADINPTKVQKLTVHDKLKILKNLLEYSKPAGIKHPLIDVLSLSISDMGSASKTTFLVKSKYGYPTGCGPGNGTTAWQEPKKWRKDAIKYVYSASNAILALLYNDFLLYGPIEKAEYVFPACAVAEIIKSDLIKQAPASKRHPALKFFPEMFQQGEIK
jgi:tetrahydromethanopterin S-methyltransferase subunit H